MRIRRQQRAVVIPVRAQDLPTAVAILRLPNKRALRGHHLYLRVRDSGRLHVNVGGGTRLHALPYLTGQLRQDGHRMILDTVVHESRTGAYLPLLYFATAAVLGLVAVVMTVTRQFANPGLYVTGVGALLLVTVGLRLTRIRFDSFERDADLVMRTVRSVVLSGTGQPGPTKHR